MNKSASERDARLNEHDISIIISRYNNMLASNLVNDLNFSRILLEPSAKLNITLPAQTPAELQTFFASVVIAPAFGRDWEGPYLWIHGFNEDFTKAKPWLYKFDDKGVGSGIQTIADLILVDLTLNVTQGLNQVDIQMDDSVDFPLDTTPTTTPDIFKPYDSYYRRYPVWTLNADGKAGAAFGGAPNAEYELWPWFVVGPSGLSFGVNAVPEYLDATQTPIKDNDGVGFNNGPWVDISTLVSRRPS